MTDEPAVLAWMDVVRAHRKPRPPRPRVTPCSPRHRSCSPAHRALVCGYRDARDARDRLREADVPVPAAYAGGALVTYMQLEDEQFDQAVPKVLFRDWLIQHAHRGREPIGWPGVGA